MECIQFIFDACKNCKQDKPILIMIYNKRKCVHFNKILSYLWHSFLIVYDNIGFIDNTKCTDNLYIPIMAATLTLVAACIQYVVVVVYFSIVL